MPYLNKCLWYPNRKQDHEFNIIFFPYAGGGVPSFYKFVQDFKDTANCYVVELPGRGSRFNEEFYTDMNDVVLDLAQVISKLKGPSIFIGHSMGALIAYELSLHLEVKYNLAPKRLIVSGATSPFYPKQYNSVSTLPRQQFINKLKELRGTSAEVLDNTELLELLIPILRADFALCEKYKCKTNTVINLDCPIISIYGSEDTLTPREGMEKWSELTRKNFKIKSFDGDHFFINSNYRSVIRYLLPILKNDIHY
jgi:medium-chain acyl-[acyl-carrier-protein] hydrolase